MHYLITSTGAKVEVRDSGLIGQFRIALVVESEAMPGMPAQVLLSAHNAKEIAHVLLTLAHSSTDPRDTRPESVRRAEANEYGCAHCHTRVKAHHDKYPLCLKCWDAGVRLPEGTRAIDEPF